MQIGDWNVPSERPGSRSEETVKTEEGGQHSLCLFVWGFLGLGGLGCC